MSTFNIINVSGNPVTVFGSSIYPNAKLDLLTVATASQIIESMRNGELYELMQGLRVAALNAESFKVLGCTSSDLDYFSYCGFMNGMKDTARMKYPFHFTRDGYLLANISGITIPPLTVDIHGDSVIPADRDSILSMGTSDGTIGGTVSVIKIGPDGYVQVKDMIADGYLNSINNIPTETEHNYSTSRNDGVAVRLSDTTITFTGPTIVSNQIRKVIVNTGTVFNMYEQGRVTSAGTTYITISGTTITLAGCGAAPVPAGSTVEVLWAAQDKGYDSSTQSVRVFPVVSDASRSILQDCSQATALAGGTTTSFYLDMNGYHGFSLQIYSLAGTYAKAVKIYASNQDDGTAPASCVYNDMTLDWAGTSVISLAAGTVTSAYFLNKPTATYVKYIKIEVSVGLGAVSDNLWVMYARKVY